MLLPPLLACNLGLKAKRLTGNKKQSQAEASSPVHTSSIALPRLALNAVCACYNDELHGKFRQPNNIQAEEQRLHSTISKVGL